MARPSKPRVILRTSRPQSVPLDGNRAGTAAVGDDAGVDILKTGYGVDQVTALATVGGKVAGGGGPGAVGAVFADLAAKAVVGPGGGEMIGAGGGLQPAFGGVGVGLALVEGVTALGGFAAAVIGRGGGARGIAIGTDGDGGFLTIGVVGIGGGG